jgi:hypothetical protein
MRAPNPNTPPLLRSVRLVWYFVALVPIVALVYLGITGVIPFYLAMLAIFAFFFWVFSFLFALYEKFVRRNENVR